MVNPLFKSLCQQFWQHVQLADPVSHPVSLASGLVTNVWREYSEAFSDDQGLRARYIKNGMEEEEDSQS